jgi:hypothetical protein
MIQPRGWQQGAIHYGFAISSLLASSAMSEVKCIKLTYGAPCCEEKLPNFMLINALSPPPVESVKGHPLLYATCNVEHLEQSPTKRALLKYTQAKYLSQAITYMLLERILASSNLYLIGMTEKSAPVVEPLCVTKVTGVGIPAICYLLLPLNKVEADEILEELNPNCLTELSLICLLPEVLPHFRAFISTSFIADMFMEPHAVSCLLTQTLLAEIYDLIWDDGLKLKTLNLIHFSSVRIGLQRIIKTWSKQVWIATSGSVDITDVSQSLSETRVTEGVQSVELEFTLLGRLISRYGAEMADLICKICPIRVPQIPVETGAQVSRKYKQATDKKLISKSLSERKKFKETCIPVIKDHQDYPASFICAGILGIGMSVSHMSTLCGVTFTRE